MKAWQRLATAIRQQGRDELGIEEFQQAAVLVPIVERAGSLALAYTVRPADMPTHAGQVAFPGGHRHVEDDSVFDTALREAEEELGIDRTSVNVCGAIDDVASPVGYVITPVVGWLHDPPPFEVDRREVDDHFEVPVDELLDPARVAYRGENRIDGRVYPLHEYHVAGHLIWGVTARITRRLLALLEPVLRSRP